MSESSKTFNVKSDGIYPREDLSVWNTKLTWFPPTVAKMRYDSEGNGPRMDATDNGDKQVKKIS
jgi:hypothetical protein